MPRAGKFSHFASVVAVSAVLILLSVSAAGERRCLWCGPLAEQVHRSQRAPSCAEPGETTCDAGLSHCAIVASSPPYVESRLCVKYYQDECYSIFCNSSRTWRMTCPCRGDLCNTEKTEREDEAFAFLARLGSKIQNVRIKKRTVTLRKFISQRTKPDIVNNENDMSNGAETQQADLDNITHASQSVPTSNIGMKDPDMNDSNDDGTTNKLNANSNKNEVNNEDNDNSSPENMNDSNTTTNKSNIDSSNIENINENQDQTTTGPQNAGSEVYDIIPAATESSVNITPMDQIVKLASTIETPHKDINMDVVNNIDNAAEKSDIEKSVDEKIMMKSDIKPSMGMPAAEALQQNTSPAVVSEKTLPTTEQTTTITTMTTMTTEGYVHVTVTSDPMKMKKNNAVAIYLNYLLTVFWVMLNFV